MKYHILTLDFPTGVSGRIVARSAASRLGLPCYDREVISYIAKRTSLNQDFITEQCTYAPDGLSFSRPFGQLSLQDNLWLLQREAVLRLAEKGPCLILGHCADDILRSREDCLRVFLSSPLSARAASLSRSGESLSSQRKKLLCADRRRKAYYRTYTGAVWGARENYHLALNCSALGVETCTELIIRSFLPQFCFDTAKIAASR